MRAASELGLPAVFGTDYQKLSCTWDEETSGLARATADEKLDSNGYYLYAVVSAIPFSRLSGTSCILYVGKGSAERIGSLWAGRHSGIRAFRQVVPKLLVKSERQLTVVAKPYTTHMAASLNEAKALTQIVREHGEMPPCNGRWEGYILGRVLKALVEPFVGEGERLMVYDWPRQNPVATWVTVYRREAEWSLCWVWTDWTDDWTARPVDHPPGVEGGDLLLVTRDGRGELPKSLGNTVGGYEGKWSVPRLGCVELKSGDSVISMLVKVLEETDFDDAKKEAFCKRVAEELSREGQD